LSHAASSNGSEDAEGEQSPTSPGGEKPVGGVEKDSVGTCNSGETCDSEEMSFVPRRAWGGVHSTLPLRAERPLIRRVRQVLQRLVADAAEDDGPRLDAERAMARLLAHRQDWATVRHEETGRPALLVLVDVSGSCSVFCDDAVRIAAAVGALGLEGADVVVVVHSNGYPAQAAINGRALDVPRAWPSDEAVVKWYSRAIAARDIRHIVLLGDGDGEWLYRDLAHRSTVESLIWLDGYRARVYGAPRMTTRDTRRVIARVRKSGWSHDAAHKVRYVAGCGDVAQFARALEVAVR
jgi:hypothetical protein